MSHTKSNKDRRFRPFSPASPEASAQRRMREPRPSGRQPNCAANIAFASMPIAVERIIYIAASRLAWREIQIQTCQISVILSGAKSRRR